MGKQYNQLSLDERCTISGLFKAGNSIQEIAAALARSKSTISREIKRNITKTKGYEASYAQLQTVGRRWHGSKLERQSALRNEVLDFLTMGMSPQQVSGRLAREKGCSVISHESIYRFIYAQIKRTDDYKWRHYLPRSKSKRGFRSKGGGSAVLFIKDRVSIHERDEVIENRHEIGHWEADLMLFSKHGQNVLVLHERYSRVDILLRIKNKEAKTVIFEIKNLLKDLPQALCKTVTFDNGTEFAEHYQLNKLGIKTYFCDVRSPWQKGGIENSIGRLRRYLPRKTDLDTWTTKNINNVMALYNNTPRKCLDYQTPAEFFNNKVLHLKCDSTRCP
ncbi:MAG: IS30 family transposase [Gammaproteobacteria bacterium]|nr:IS30 family transposase [Gammaproteobacteria bacterium]